MATPSSSSTSTSPDSAPPAASDPSSQKQKRNRRDLAVGNPKSQYFKVWFCCQCGDGPLNAKLVSVCPSNNCSRHYRCKDCDVHTLEKHD